MRLLALLLLVSVTASASGRFERFCGRTDTGRSDRGLLCGGAFFEAFPSNGAGTNGVCNKNAAPTGSRGEVLSFGRASNATCTKTASGGLATSGIADGDLELFGSNVARVEYDSSGVPGLLVEAQGINLLPRFDALTNALWSNVGTPGVTDGATDPFGATTGDTITDDDPAAFEGRSQPVTVSAGAATYAYCYVKAGTLAKARIVLDGTAATITGLSTSTWSIIEVADASASGVSISFQVTNGSVVGDTGTVIWGGCDVKAATYRTSIVPTAGSTATRVPEEPYFTIPATEVQSIAASLNSSGGFLSNARVFGAWKDANNFTEGYIPGPGASAFHSLQFVASSSKDLTAATNVPLNATTRLVAWVIPSTTIGAVVGGTETTSSAGVLGALTGVTRVYVGKYNATTGYEVNGIVSRLCVDPDSLRCR